MDYLQDVDASVQRVVDLLQLLRFKTPYDQMTFTEGLKTGDRNVIFPILNWLLVKREFLTQRAYIIHYLHKIEIPQEYMTDESA